MRSPSTTQIIETAVKVAIGCMLPFAVWAGTNIYQNKQDIAVIQNNQVQLMEGQEIMIDCLFQMAQNKPCTLR